MPIPGEKLVWPLSTEDESADLSFNEAKRIIESIRRELLRGRTVTLLIRWAKGDLRHVLICWRADESHARDVRECETMLAELALIEATI